VKPDSLVLADPGAGIIALAHQKGDQSDSIIRTFLNNIGFDIFGP